MKFLRLFSRKPTFSDDALDLVLSNEDVSDPEYGIDDGYTFNIFRHKTRDYVGYVSLRKVMRRWDKAYRLRLDNARADERNRMKNRGKSTVIERE